LDVLGFFEITMTTYESLSAALKALKEKGYTHDFNLHPEWIECPPLKLRLAPEEFHVDEVHRFEGMTNPDDSSILFAISSSSGVKGVLVDAYGAYADAISPVMVQKLRIDNQTHQ
jgi:hypothetical protein